MSNLNAAIIGGLTGLVTTLATRWFLAGGPSYWLAARRRSEPSTFVATGPGATALGSDAKASGVQHSDGDPHG